MRLLFLFILSTITVFALELNVMLPKILLSADEGGTLEKLAWDSSSLKDKVHVVFYVDPDEKSTNNEASEALKKENFDRQYYGSVAVINMAASWLPNWALDNALQEKQANYPDTLYIKDMNKKLVQAWDIKDDSSNIYVIDKEGIVRFKHEGKLDETAISLLIKTIKAYM